MLDIVYLKSLCYTIPQRILLSHFQNGKAASMFLGSLGAHY